MKKIASLSLVILVVLSSCTSTTTSIDENSLKSNSETYKALYEQSSEMGDMQTAATALQLLLLEDTSNMGYMDSLARIYLRGGMMQPGLQLAEKVLKSETENLDLLEMVAAGRAYNSDYDGALEAYNKLYDNENRYFYLYQIATIEANRQNISNAQTVLNKILKDVKADELIDARTANGGSQKVNVRAAAYFLKAQIAGSQNDIASVSKYLNKALAISPDYQEAQISVNQIQQYQQQAAQAAGRQQAPRKNNKLEAEKRRMQEYLNKNK